ncbi:hypothetical protein EGW08_005869 [Elysia chlorotica]|uniref:Uncharacterized protein n=1 Tax=Elysia chlorotica TaxID=188477 RepID=A0A3S1HUG2_ELYCH|nr:hypothetical protein EGW08_005869 [Elysia chlorotica]
MSSRNQRTRHTDGHSAEGDNVFQSAITTVSPKTKPSLGAWESSPKHESKWSQVRSVQDHRRKYASTGSTASTSLTGSTTSTSLTGSTASTSLTGSTASTSLTGSTTSTSLTGSTASTSLTGSTASTSLTGSTASTSISGGTASTSVTGNTISTYEARSTIGTYVIESTASSSVSGSTSVTGGTVRTSVAEDAQLLGDIDTVTAYVISGESTASTLGVTEGVAPDVTQALPLAAQTIETVTMACKLSDSVTGDKKTDTVSIKTDSAKANEICDETNESITNLSQTDVTNELETTKLPIGSFDTTCIVSEAESGKSEILTTGTSVPGNNSEENASKFDNAAYEATTIDKIGKTVPVSVKSGVETTGISSSSSILRGILQKGIKEFVPLRSMTDTLPVVGNTDTESVSSCPYTVPAISSTWNWLTNRTARGEEINSTAPVYNRGDFPKCVPSGVNQSIVQTNPCNQKMYNVSACEGFDKHIIYGGNTVLVYGENSSVKQFSVPNNSVVATQQVATVNQMQHSRAIQHMGTVNHITGIATEQIGTAHYIPGIANQQVRISNHIIPGMAAQQMGTANYIPGRATQQSVTAHPVQPGVTIQQMRNTIPGQMVINNGPVHISNDTIARYTTANFPTYGVANVQTFKMPNVLPYQDMVNTTSAQTPALTPIATHLQNRSFSIAPIQSNANSGLPQNNAGKTKPRANFDRNRRDLRPFRSWSTLDIPPATNTHNIVTLESRVSSVPSNSASSTSRSASKMATRKLSRKATSNYSPAHIPLATSDLTSSDTNTAENISTAATNSVQNTAAACSDTPKVTNETPSSAVISARIDKKSAKIANVKTSLTNGPNVTPSTEAKTELTAVPTASGTNTAVPRAAKIVPAAAAVTNTLPIGATVSAPTDTIEPTTTVSTLNVNGPVVVTTNSTHAQARGETKKGCKKVKSRQIPERSEGINSRIQSKTIASIANEPNASIANEPNASIANEPNASIANEPNASIACETNTCNASKTTNNSTTSKTNNTYTNNTTKTDGFTETETSIAPIEAEINCARTQTNDLQIIATEIVYDSTNRTPEGAIASSSTSRSLEKTPVNPSKNARLTSRRQKQKCRGKNKKEGQRRSAAQKYTEKLEDAMRNFKRELSGTKVSSFSSTHP